MSFSVKDLWKSSNTKNKEGVKMGQNIPPSDLLSKLHRDAEKQLGNKMSTEYPNISDKDIRALGRDLQVHKIELEMQNEELRNANTRVENALNKYYELYELAPAGYFTVNEDGRILEINLSGSELLNINKQFVINNYFQNFVTEDCLSTYKTFTTNIFETNRKQKCEIKLKKNEFAAIHVEIQGLSMKNSSGNQKHMIISAFDISERIKAEEIKEEARKLYEEESIRQLKETKLFDKMKTEFFSNQSHELRTPLNVIFGTLQLIELQKQSSQTEAGLKLDKHLHTIRQNCLRLLRLINNIIDVTKIESGFIEKNLHNGNIVSIVEDIVLSVSEYIENKGISIQFDTEIEERIIAYDADKIERIILNLLSNAVKFTKPGGDITVNIYDRCDSIEISIRDSGIGIPEDKLDSVFERFRQVDMSLTREYEGSGIGLSLVKSLVEMQGGSINVVSEYGKSSEFIINFPILLVEESSSNVVENNDYQARIERFNIEFADIYN